MKKLTHKRHGSKLPLPKPLPKPVYVPETVPEPVHAPVQPIRRLRRPPVSEWQQVWRICKKVPLHIKDLCHKLIIVAKHGTKHGRYIRVSSLQAEIVLGMFLVYTLSTLAWIIGWFI